MSTPFPHPPMVDPIVLRRCLGTLAAAALFALPSVAAAQEPAAAPVAQPDSGARVRVYAPTLLDARMVGRFLHVTPDSLFMLREGPGAAPAHLFAVARPEVSVLEVSRGGRRVSVVRGSVIGGFIGGGLGFFFSALGGGTRGEQLLGVGAAAAVGAATGGLVGSSGERWEPVPVPAPPSEG